MKTKESWATRVGGWVEKWRQRLGGRAAPARPDAPCPDYVTCPFCGEPEVEVWCYEEAVRCHNCGQTFAHALSVDDDAGCPQCHPPEA